MTLQITNIRYIPVFKRDKNSEFTPIICVNGIFPTEKEALLQIDPEGNGPIAIVKLEIFYLNEITKALGLLGRIG